MKLKPMSLVWLFVAGALTFSIPVYSFWKIKHKEDRVTYLDGPVATAYTIEQVETIYSTSEPASETVNPTVVVSPTVKPTTVPVPTPTSTPKRFVRNDDLDDD